MDWKLSIRKNREALVTIVAGLIAMVRQTETMPSPVRRSITRILRPAESALRRLIVVVAAVLSQKAREAAEARAEGSDKSEIPLPDFSTFARYDRLPAFPLIDPYKRFWAIRRISAADIPRISVPGVFDRTPLPEPKEPADAASLLRRIRKLQYALHTLPRQARRLNRLMVKRSKAEPGPGRTGPIRPGHPPGHQTKPRHQVDNILRDCHWLALDSGFKPP